MFEVKRIDLLENKMNLLIQRELYLLKEGKQEEADKVSEEINETSRKIQELDKKMLDKTAAKSEKLSQKHDQKLEQYQQILPKVTDDETEDFLKEVKKSK